MDGRRDHSCGCCAAGGFKWNHDEAYYRCRYPQEYALANTIDHPRNVYLAERDVLPQLEDWLAQAFAPTRLETTIDQNSTRRRTTSPA